MKKITAGLLALILVCSLFGCVNTTPNATVQTTEPSTATQETTPAIVETYSQAATALREAQDLKVKLTTKKAVTAQGSKFSFVSKQVLTMTGIGTDAFVATLQEEAEVGGYESKFNEYFANDVLYVNVGEDGYFQGDMNASDFLAGFTPAVLLDEALYANISTQESPSSVTVNFSNPTAAESWALPQGAKFLTASGTAKITNDGDLTKSVYRIEYIQGGTTVSMEVIAEAEAYDGKALEAPQDANRYVKIDAIQAPRLYETAVLYLCSSPVASSNINQTILCEAAGYTRAGQIELHYAGVGADHLSKVQQTMTSVDSTGTKTTIALLEKFQNGRYTSSENGGAEIPNSSVTTKVMVDYVLGMHLDSLPASEYFSSFKLENVNGLLLLEAEMNAEWGKLTAKDLAYQLFNNENFLDDYSTAYATTTASYYMFLDAATGFPVSAGVTFAGAHTIEGKQYVLAQEISRSYRLADCSTYKELTGKLPAETAPKEQATPLLYRVTGADGQEMYLMGTIHIGDEKTGFLPDEVYDAFAASDALAVEVDIVAFEEKLEKDPQLTAQMVALFTNPGNGPTKALLDAELYDTAIKLLKASGNYNSGMEFMKPFVWNSSIESFFATLGGLHTEKGMDMRLLTMAKEQNKKILEVESGMFQYEMFAGFSADLQEILLGTTAAATVTEYCQEAQSLYDLWCAGDENALRECLKDDTSDMTAEEKALYQEYINAMIIERNDSMLDVAISYLESDETVFYAVGLAHLLQENGLVDALRAGGYTVEPVVYKN